MPNFSSEVGPLLLRDRVVLERLVVAAMLQHLGDVALDAAALADRLEWKNTSPGLSASSPTLNLP